MPVAEIAESSVCPMCGSNQLKIWGNAYDDRYGHPNLYQLLNCVECDHVATFPRLTEAELPNLYGNYYPRRVMSADSIRNSAAKVVGFAGGFRRWFFGVDNQGQYLVGRGEKLLDVGCGGGQSLIEATLLGAKAYGVEADPNVSRLAKELNLEIYQGRISDNPFPGKKFDLIVLNQVIEHIPDAAEMLNLLSGRLTSTGRIILVFPNRNSIWRRIFGAAWINWHVPYHQHHFNAKTMKALASRCNYRILRSRTITPNLWIFLQVRASLATIKMGRVNPLWIVADQASHENAQTKNINMRQFAMSLILVLLALPLRLVDSLGFGDSLMLELVGLEKR